MGISELRREYRGKPLRQKDLPKEPHRLFEQWFEEAVRAEVPDVNALTLCTADGLGNPSGRTVLFKGCDAEKGFTFFTNYGSRKAQDLAANPRGCMVFFWGHLNRQILISGRIRKIAKSKSQAYFKSRPRGSQLAALISRQSRPVTSRKDLDEAFGKAQKEYEGQDILMPKDWGGFSLRADRFEFWQGRESRLHDRFLYELGSDGNWSLSRLYP